MQSNILLNSSYIFECLTVKNVQNLILICKWGGDGRCHKQQLGENISDENFFFTAFVSWQLISENVLTNQKIEFWKNRRLFSPRFRRPIKMQFTKESIELI